MPKTGSSIIRHLIRQYRLVAELTQKELAEKCGLNESTIRNYELGNRYPDDDTILKIANALKISYFTLAEPNPFNVYGALHTLFALENTFGLKPKIVDGEVHLVFDELNSFSNGATPGEIATLKAEVKRWADIYGELEDGNITSMDYFMWESKYPIKITPEAIPEDFYDNYLEAEKNPDANKSNEDNIIFEGEDVTVYEGVVGNEKEEALIEAIDSTVKFSKRIRRSQ